MRFEDYLKKSNVQAGQHVLIHGAYRKLRTAFPGLTIEGMIETLQRMLGPGGSIILPAFTYCFKRSVGAYEVFDPRHSASKTGMISEIFRSLPGVVRTSSATHSFALWGSVTCDIQESNSPASPLGKESVLDWLVRQEDACALMLGTDFTSFSLGHYLEVAAPVPWANVSPWDHLHVLKTGVSVAGEQALREIPGCAKSFVSFEKWLTAEGLIRYHQTGAFRSCCIPVKVIYERGLEYFRRYPLQLLCAPSVCPACDGRWAWYQSHHRA